MSVFLRTLAALCCISVTLPAAEPRLILVLSIDQMRYDYLTRFGPLFQGGFKTLLEKGAVFTNAHYRHSSTETGPGHSVILSGRHGSHTGIVGNDWWDPFLKKTINVVEDPVQTTIGGSGRAASPANFSGFTVGDKIKQKWPGSKVFGVSMKDRSAILMGGRRADGAFWFETTCGCFITSSYYLKEAPGWLTEFNARKLPDQYVNKPWTRLREDESLYEKYAGPDKAPGEHDLKDIAFPHAFTAKPPASAYYTAFTRSPYSDEVLLQAALQILNTYKLGADASPDVLAVSFSAPDAIGHAWGAYSQEEMDEYLRLDLVLGKLLQAVETAVGADNLQVVLTADHGAVPVVEWLNEHGVPEARRHRSAVLSEAVNKALAKRYPQTPNLVANFSNPDFYLDVDAIRKAGLSREKVERVAIDALKSTGAVEQVYTHADLLGMSGLKDPLLPLFQNSFFEPRSPTLTVRIKQNNYIGGAGGSGHGTAYEYDRHVPVIWMGAGVKPGRYEQAAGPEDIAPTIAKLLSIPYPIEPDARLLTEVLP